MGLTTQQGRYLSQALFRLHPAHVATITMVDVSQNSLEEIPSAVVFLPSLRALDISHNPISTLPLALNPRVSLKADGNPLSRELSSTPVASAVEPRPVVSATTRSNLLFFPTWTPVDDPPFASLIAPDKHGFRLPDYAAMLMSDELLQSCSSLASEPRADNSNAIGPSSHELLRLCLRAECHFRLVNLLPVLR